LIPWRLPYNRPPRAHRRRRGIALLNLNLGVRRRWVVSTTPRPLYPRERPGTHCTAGWVVPRAGLDVCEKSRPHRDWISWRCKGNFPFFKAHKTALTQPSVQCVSGPFPLDQLPASHGGWPTSVEAKHAHHKPLRP
jgi:hypothetical protein